MLVSLQTVSLWRCSKPGCLNTNLVRHHKRNEHRWVKHFDHQLQSPKKSVRLRYAEFKARYERFEPRDIVLICQDHHEEAHVSYEKMLREALQAKKFKPLRCWTWREANAFMDKCEVWCKWWLKQETPGVPRHLHRLTK